MARLNTNAELWSHLSSFKVLWDSTTGLSTTVSTGGCSSGGSTCGTAATSTGLAAGDYVRIGPRGGTEIAWIEAKSTAGFTAKNEYIESHSSGESVVEQVVTDLGDIADSGISVDVTADVTTINVATQRHAYAHHVAHTDYACTVQLENLSVENLLTCMGIPDSQIHGAGSTADPYVADWVSDRIDTITPLNFLGQGTRKDGTNIDVLFMDCDFNPAKTIALARGQDAPVEFTFYARLIRWMNPV